MSNVSSNAPPPNLAKKPLPTWITLGVMGLVLGGGAGFMVAYYLYAPAEQLPYTGTGADVMAAAGGGGAPGGGTGGGGMMGGGMGGGGMMGGGMMGGGGMGGGGMGGGGMGGGGMGGGGGGGGARGKRNLTSIVGKINLASKGVTFRLDDEQSAKLAAQLANLDQVEKMTQEEAQERCDAIEALLTDEQKDTLAQFEVPRGAGGGGPGGGGPGGPAGAANATGSARNGPGPGAGGGSPGGSGGTDDNNPFQEETNQSRLHSLLDRLKTAAVAEEPAKAETTDAQ